jgi:hypothetical protein
MTQPQDLDGNGAGGGAVSDNTDEPFIPYKSGDSLENSPLQYNAADGKVEASSPIVGQLQGDLVGELILTEPVTKGDLVSVDPTIPPVDGIESGGIADKNTQGRRPAIGFAQSNGLIGEKIQYKSYGPSEADTTGFVPGTVISMGSNGKAEYSSGIIAQQVGVVRETGPNGRVFANVLSWRKAPTEGPADPGGDLDDSEFPVYNAATDDLNKSGVFLEDEEVDFYEKSIKAKHYDLRENQRLDTTGANLAEYKIHDSTIHYHTDVEHGTNVPVGKNFRNKVVDEVGQAVNTETLLSPRWIIPVTEDISIEALTMDSTLLSFDGATINAYRDSVLIWSQKILLLLQGPSKWFNVGTGSSFFPPIHFLNDGATYELEVTNEFGDLQVQGDTLGVPYYALDYSEIVERPLQTMPDSTGVLDGMTVSQGTGDSVSITPGFGYIMADDGKTGTYVEIGQITDSPISVVADGNFGIGIDVNGAVTQVAGDSIDAAFIRDYMLVGFVEVELGAVSNVSPYKLTTNTTYSQIMDLFEVLGVIAGQGLDISPQANLSFDISAGDLGFRGAGTSQLNRTPNVLQLDARVTAEFDRLLGLDQSLPTLNQTLIDADHYDDGTATPALIADPLNATIQYLYQLPIELGGLTVMYGQTVYPTIEDAIVNQDNDEISIPTFVSTNTLLLARLVVRAGATNLQDEADAVWLPGSKFGASIKGGALGSGGPGGGDMLGAASSTLNEVVTFADVSGKVASAASDISADGGKLARISANGTLFVRGGASLPQLAINPVTDSISLQTDGPVYSVVNTDNGGTLTGLPGSTAFSAVRSDNPQFVLKNQAGVTIGKLEYNTTDGFIAIRYDGGPEIAVDADEIRHDIGTTTWRQTATGIVWDSDTNPAIHALRSDVVSYLITDAAGDSQGFFSYLSPNDYVTVGRSSGANVQVKTEGVNIVSNNSELTVDDIPVVLDNVGRTALTPAASVEIDFTEYESVYTLAMDQNTTLTFANIEVGHAVQLEVTGNFTLTFPGTAFKLSTSADYSGTDTNIIYMYASDAGIIDYTIAQRGT